MKFENLLYEVNERIATITLNRPERLNAINYTLPRELRRVEVASGVLHIVRERHKIYADTDAGFATATASSI